MISPYRGQVCALMPRSADWRVFDGRMAGRDAESKCNWDRQQLAESGPALKSGFQHFLEPTVKLGVIEARRSNARSVTQVRTAIPAARYTAPHGFAGVHSPFVLGRNHVPDADSTIPVEFICALLPVCRPLCDIKPLDFLVICGKVPQFCMSLSWLKTCKVSLATRHSVAERTEEIMELDANMSGALVELIKTKNGATDSDVANFEIHWRPSTFEDALEKAVKLSRAQAHEVWHALQLLVSHESLDGRPAAVVELAMEFNPLPVTWKVIADKALEYEHFTIKQKP